MWRGVLLYVWASCSVAERALFVRVCSACDVSLSYVGDFIAFRPGINVIRMYGIELYPHYICAKRQQWSTPN